MESEAVAADRGAVDKAIVSLLSQGGLRRSEAAALRWTDVQDATDGRGIVVYVRRSKTDQDGTAADVRYLKNGCAVALRQLRDRITVRRSGLRPEPTDQVLGGLNGQSNCAPPRSSGQGRRHRRPDRRPPRARRPRFRIDGTRGQHHRDDACRCLENRPHGHPPRGGRNRRAGRRRDASTVTARHGANPPGWEHRPCFQGCASHHYGPGRGIRDTS